MPNGGWVHYEQKNIKHPCLHRGDGLSKKRDNLTHDLFETVTEDLGQRNLAS